jgi:hypothetical protein
MTTHPALTAYQLHLPDDLRIFHYGAPPIAETADVLVFEGWSDDRSAICRSYLFFNRWLEVFVTFDASFNLRPDPDYLFPFAFNCDITTPYHRVGKRLYTTDLCLDLLVAADGRSYHIEDRDELEDWHQSGVISTAGYKAALREQDSLLNLFTTGRFLDLLTAIAPFPTAPPRAHLSTMERLDRKSAGFVEYPYASRW